MKIRTIEATVFHAESNRREARTLTLLFDDRSERFTLTKVYVLEFQQRVVFDKEENLVILPD